MQRAKDEKIGLGRKRRLIPFKYLIIIYAVVMLLGIGLILIRQNIYKTETLQVTSGNYKLLVASSDAQQAKGLGGLASLPQNQGMLFPFNSAETRCFWMKDMHFPIDILWLSSVKKVVYIQQNVSPKTYPATFCPPEATKYVIELNSGQVKAADIKVGQTLIF